MIEVHIKVVLVQLQIFASTSYEFGLRKTYKKKYQQRLSNSH